MYLAYVAAAVVVLAVPGPTIMLVVSYSLAEGKRAAASMVAGVGLGDLTAMTMSMAGLGAVMTASAELFTALKWVGGVYLVYLGVKLWRAKPTLEEALPLARSRQAMLVHAWLVTALNPKGIVFFVAFLPQFLDPARPATPQMVVLGGTFLVMAVVNAGLYALAAATMRGAMQRPSLIRAVNRVGGSFLVGAGLLTAATRRN
jgi:threonine/homoserine/homoserine lactone efflux protein